MHFRSDSSVPQKLIHSGMKKGGEGNGGTGNLRTPAEVPKSPCYGRSAALFCHDDIHLLEPISAFSPLFASNYPMVEFPEGRNLQGYRGIN